MSEIVKKLKHWRNAFEDRSIAYQSLAEISAAGGGTGMDIATVLSEAIAALRPRVFTADDVDGSPDQRFHRAPAPVAVTDEMVERAARATCKVYCCSVQCADDEHKTCGLWQSHAPGCEDALQAALGAQAGGE